MDVSYAHGAHNMKFGGTVSATKLSETLPLGLTDPTLNSPCVDADGNPSDDTTLTSGNQCGSAGLAANDGFVPGLLPFDLSRGGTSVQL